MSDIVQIGAVGVRIVAYFRAGVKNPPRRRTQQPRHHPQETGLAAAVRPGQHQHPARWHGEVQTFKHLTVATNAVERGAAKGAGGLGNYSPFGSVMKV